MNGNQDNNPLYPPDISYEMEMKHSAAYGTQMWRIPIGPELRDLMAFWAAAMEKPSPGGYPDWRAVLLKWLVKGRIKLFIKWAKKHPCDASNQALAGLQIISEMEYPSCGGAAGPMWSSMWRWSKRELEGCNVISKRNNE